MLAKVTDEKGRFPYTLRTTRNRPSGPGGETCEEWPLSLAFPHSCDPACARTCKTGAEAHDFGDVANEMNR